MGNPFTPGNGIEPVYLAGRQSYLQDFQKSLKISEDGLPQNLVLFGLRGVGKTVLLRRFKLIAEAQNWAVVEREVTEKHMEESILAHAIGRDVVNTAAELCLEAKIKKEGKRIVDLLKPEELTAHGISWRPFYKEQKELMEDYLKELFVNNWKAIKKSGKKGLVLLYDEFHQVRDGKNSNFPLESLLGALAYAQREGCRYYIVFSGLPNLKTNLKQARTYTERMFAFRELDNLPYEAAQKALVKPLENSEYSFEDKLIERIVEQTRGYPYFLQFYGFYLIRTSLHQHITLKDFEKKEATLCHELDVSFFEDRYNLASEKEKEVLLAMAKSGHDKITMKEVTKNCKMPYFTLREFILRLIDKGLVYKFSRATYSFTVPLFKQYLQKQL